MTGLHLRPLEDADIALVRQWLALPHIKKWFPDAEGWLTKIRGRQGDYSWSTHFLIFYDKVPIGVCMYYDWFYYGKDETWYRADAPGYAYSFDYLIGEEEYLGKGHGKSIVRLLTEAIRQGTDGKVAVLKPEADNEASKRAIGANGYEFLEDAGYFIKRFE